MGKALHTPLESNIQIIGLGPAVTAGLFPGADHAGALRELVSGAVCIDGGRYGQSQSLGKFKNTSNSEGREFTPTTASGHPKNGKFNKKVLNTPEAQRLIEAGSNQVPLDTAVRPILKVYRREALELITELSPAEIQWHTRITTVRLLDEGLIQSENGNGTDYKRPIAISRKLILATGSREVLHTSLRDLQRKTFLSTDILNGHKLPELKTKVRNGGKKEITIIGSSHAAGALIEVIRKDPELKEIPIHVIGRDFRPYYPNAKTAHAGGYRDFTDEDICPDTGRINRFNGVRVSTEELQVARYAKHPNTKFTVIKDSFTELPPEVLENTGAIIQAIGLTVNTPKLYGPNGEELEWNIQNGHAQVDSNHRVQIKGLDVQPEIFGIGIGWGVKGKGPKGTNTYLDSINAFQTAGEVIAHQLTK